MIKIQRLASISCQTDQNNSKLQKRSNYNVLHRIDVKTIKNVAFRRKTFERTLNYKSNQITTICIDLTSKRSKMLSYVAKHSKQHKTTKVIKLQWLASIWCQKHQNNEKLQTVIKLQWIASIWRHNDQKCWISQNNQNNSKLQKRSNYNELHRFDVITIKMLSYVAMHSKQHKTTKVIKLQWLASIWCQNIENNPKLK